MASTRTLLFVTYLLGACLCISVQGQAPAPAPVALAPGPAAAAANQTVTGVFVLTAASAVFMNSTSLTMTGIPNVTEYVTFPPTPRAGSLPQPQFVSPGLAPTNGTWLGGPQSSLSGIYNGQQKTVLLTLSKPIYIPDTNTLAFSYVVLPSNATFPAVGGTVNQYASASSGAEGNGATTLPYVVPGSTTFYNASLTIDVVNIVDYISGSQKSGLIRVDLGANNYYGYGYGRK